MGRVAAIGVGLIAVVTAARATEPASRRPAEPDSDPPSVEQAQALLLAGEPGRAADAFARILAAGPPAGAAALGRVDALLELDRWETALEEARRLHERSPGDALVVTALAEALYRAGKLEEAERLLVPRCAANQHPDGRALTLLGLLDKASGRSAEAVALMRRALEASPGDRRVVFRAAEATATRAESIQLLERYLELSRGDDADRIEAARGTLGVLRSLGDREVWVARRRPAELELPLRRIHGGDGRLAGVVIRARLGPKGRPVRLLLDTGSTGFFLFHRVARRGGFRALGEVTTFGGGGPRRHTSQRGLLPRLAIGGLEFEDALATTTPQALDPAGRYDGLVGLSIFDGYRVILDLPRRRLRLTGPGDEPGEGARYWQVSGQMLVRAGAAPAGPEGLFLLDTGATVSVVDIGFGTSVPGSRLRDGARVRGFGGTLADAKFVSGVELTFQGQGTGRGELRATDLSLRSRLGGVEVCGYLGMDLLEETRLSVDTVNRRLQVSLAGDSRDRSR